MDCSGFGPESCRYDDPFVPSSRTIKMSGGHPFNCIWRGRGERRGPMNRQNRFDTRGFVALIIALCGLGLPITGVANHLHGFNPLSVARHAWMSAHNCLGLLFILFAIWHLVLNRRALWKVLQGCRTHVHPR